MYKGSSGEGQPRMILNSRDLFCSTFRNAPRSPRPNPLSMPMGPVRTCMEQSSFARLSRRREDALPYKDLAFGIVQCRIARYHRPRVRQ